MLASIGEQGYATTVVADVIAKAVASRKTFYEHFEDKHACFFAMSDQIVSEWVERVQHEGDPEKDEPDAIEAFVDELFALALESPAALRVLAVELTAAGPTGLERRERALDELAAPIREKLGGSSADTTLLARALVGSILRLLYARARRGARVRRPRRGDLLALAPQIAAWVSCFVSEPLEVFANPSASEIGASVSVGGRAPGTLSLGSRAIERRGLPRGEGNVSRSFVIHNQRERILDSLANLSAAKGYGATTIPEIVQEAAVSVQAFYEHFSGKEDAFLVAYELGHRKALAIVERAYESQEDWPAAIRSGVVTLLAFLASEPAYAHLALIDALTASPKAAAVAHDGMNGYAAMLEPGLELSRTGNPPTVAAVEATAGALLELCFVYVATERTRELPNLEGIASDVALRPFVGSGLR
ncbi:MAG TPA: TetR/AcrR family transcriptional regulator [Solirubrobacteraceae bacterium]|nr:TetR/AcrR family transcriptional regulator [Solirubrobacteraceae bacterium]